MAGVRVGYALADPAVIGLLVGLVGVAIWVRNSLTRYLLEESYEVVEALAGNICRCGTYQRLRAAIHRAAGDAPAARGGQ